MKYYSEYLDKMFDDEKSCLEEERKAKAAAEAKDKERKDLELYLSERREEIEELTEQLSEMKGEFYQDLRNYYDRFGCVPEDCEKYFPLFIFF